MLTNSRVAAHGSPSAIPYHDTPIDTPWPHDLQDYVSLVGSFSASYSTSNAPPMSEYGQPLFDAMGDSSGGTVAKFLAGLNLDGFSELACLAKASILLERAITFSTRYSGMSRIYSAFGSGVFTRPNDSDHADAAAFNSLDVLLEQFILSLPLGLELGGVESYKRSLMVTQTLAHAATIRLHAHRIHTSNVSRSRYLAAARAVVDIINTTDFSNWPQVDPILGVRAFCLGVSKMLIYLPSLHRSCGRPCARCSSESCRACRASVSSDD